VSLDNLPEVAFAPLSFADLDMESLPRREYLMEAELVAGDKVIASARVPLVRPCAWEVCGPLDYIDNWYRGPLDGDAEGQPANKYIWVPFDYKSWDPFAVMDFGLHTSGNSNYPPEWKTIYARTRIHVPTTGTYLFKVASDDQMTLWIDGKKTFQINDKLPVTRSARTFTQKLEAGDHRIRMRVNQTDARWQASLRIRTHDDDVADVTGLDYATESSASSKPEVRSSKQ
jgi:hypothetical protein